MTIKSGQAAPTFTLMNQNNAPVSLSDFTGKKVLVYFYPKAMTPGCTVQACGLRDSKTELDAHNVMVLGISIDPVKRLSKFIERDNLNFTLLSDEDHVVCQKYGVWQLKKFMGREYMGVVRTSFLINESGNIEHVFDQFKTKDHHQIIVKFLRKI